MPNFLVHKREFWVLLHKHNIQEILRSYYTIYLRCLLRAIKSFPQLAHIFWLFFFFFWYPAIGGWIPSRVREDGMPSIRTPNSQVKNDASNH